uniref:BAG domain-containing protein n=1 Tax=Panagrolaimus sp. ES5 TaxID=591445 RepID=A0AC34FWA1_9BILA
MGQSRLPRTTFVDDPFFHHDPFDGFSRDPFPRDPRDGFTRSPQPSRRFGSTPRLIDDEFFDDTFGQGMPSAFGSLPRHRHTSRSPRPPTDRGSPPSTQYNQQQQQQPQQQQPSFQERSIPVQRASPNNNSSQTTPSKKSPIPKGAVEINNAASSYTNGELNPDRKQQQSAPDSPNMSSNIEPEIQVKKIRSDQSEQKQPQQAQTQFERTNSNGNAASEEQKQEKKEAIPLPPPLTGFAAAAEARRLAYEKRSTSVDNGGPNNKFIHLLDEAERRVELLREMASQLEQEKEQLLDTLNNVRINADFLRLDDHDREDIDATSERLMKRCRAVEVSVFTPRNEDQARALEEVNKLIEIVTLKIQEDISAAKATIDRYFNACCPDEVGPVDQRFQSMVIECTADDQKKIRRKLAQIIEQIDRAERVCNPPEY